ncbi:hypothetical protein MTR_8g081630 [Medicago truncatula]|uniref:Uncharacterized protein n=1 Tax=Medicago truncatula TaxID=3880 RepID=A0A072TUX1_MEDTR|nr:hypothetical protein MTR_8g081630 [Medicago truncatula]
MKDRTEQLQLSSVWFVKQFQGQDKLEARDRTKTAIFVPRQTTSQLFVTTKKTTSKAIQEASYAYQTKWQSHYKLTHKWRYRGSNLGHGIRPNNFDILPVELGFVD